MVLTVSGATSGSEASEGRSGAERLCGLGRCEGEGSMGEAVMGEDETLAG